MKETLPHATLAVRGGPFGSAQGTFAWKYCLRALELPPEVRQHFRNARIEVLKGMREMIDQRINRLSRAGQHGTNIAVE